MNHSQGINAAAGRMGHHCDDIQVLVHAMSKLISSLPPSFELTSLENHSLPTPPLPFLDSHLLCTSPLLSSQANAIIHQKGIKKYRNIQS